MNVPGPNRRTFLHAGIAGVALAKLASAAQTTQTNDAGIPLRPLGKTGEMVSLLCLGGHHSARDDDPRDSVRLIQRAIDEGITFLDNSWDYHDGEAELRMGKALAEGKLRDKVFLMTKGCARDAKQAAQQIDESLRRLQTDHIDLWQFHEINYDNDPDLVFADDGAIHAALKAQEQGKIRYIGFTGHKDPSMHLKMLSMPYDWASVQMPLNVLDTHFRSFQKQVLPVLNNRGIAALGMKSLGGGGQVRGGVILRGTGFPVEDALRYVMSLPIASLVTGIDSMEILEQNLKIARGFQPLSPEEMARIEAQAAQYPGTADGRFERFKTTKEFDGEYHQIQHGFMQEA